LILPKLAAEVVLCVFSKKNQLGVGAVMIFAGLQGKWLKPMFSRVTEKANLNPRATAGEFSTV
jgi:hypothetical protein